MKPSTKLHLGSAGYCALLISLNWSRSVQYSRPIGLQSESSSPFALAFLLSLSVTLYLLYRCIRAARTRLEEGRKIRGDRWITQGFVILYALPLLWHRTSGSSWRESDGAIATAMGGYGSPASNWIFLLAIIGLLLFQILIRLEPDDDESGQSLEPVHFARG